MSFFSDSVYPFRKRSKRYRIILYTSRLLGVGRISFSTTIKHVRMSCVEIFRLLTATQYFEAHLLHIFVRIFKSITYLLADRSLASIAICLNHISLIFIEGMRRAYKVWMKIFVTSSSNTVFTVWSEETRHSLWFSSLWVMINAFLNDYLIHRWQFITNINILRSQIQTVRN